MVKQLFLEEKNQHISNRLFFNSKSIVITGLIGLFLAFLFLVIIAVKGSFIPPDGYLFKPFSFNAALGLFVINMGAFIQLAGFSERGKKLWKRWLIFAAIGAYSIETIQPLRGIDPRFARNHVLSDILIGAVGMTFFSILIMIVTIALAWKLFKSDSPRKLLTYSIRCSISVILIGFLIGIVMLIAALAADYRGQYHMFMSIPAHGFSFHSLQGFPLIALLLGNKPYEKGKKLINIITAVWISVTTLLAIQTYLGQSIFQGWIFYINVFLLIVYLIILVMATNIYKNRINNVSCQSESYS